MTKIDKKVQTQQATSVKKTQTSKSTSKTTAAKSTVKANSAQPQQATNNIAQGLYDCAKKYSGAVGKEEFTKYLKQINKDNVVGVINRYNNVLSPKESIIEMILDEYLSDTKDMKEALIGEGDGKKAVRGIFTCLLDRAKEVGVDSKTISTYKTKFNKILDGELRGVAFARTSKELDEIISTVIQSIENQTKMTQATKTQLAKASITRLEGQAVLELEKKNKEAVKAFNKYLKNEKASERMAEGFSKLWGSKNTKMKVKADLEANQKQIAELNEAARKGDEAFRAKFEEIFGVAYNPVNIRAYQDAQTLYKNAAVAKSDEDSFKSAFGLLLKGGKLQEERVYQTSPTGAPYYQITASKSNVFKREFNNMAKMFDSVVKADADNFAKVGIKSGKDFLNKKFEAANAKTEDDKYAVLSNLAKQIATGLAAATKKACGGRSFDAIEKQYTNSYKAAYGLNNDVQKRVSDYIDSQIKGGGYVKMIGTMAAVMAISVATSGAGTGAAAEALSAGAAAAKSAAVGAATFAGTKFVVDVADNFSTPELREVLKKEGVKAFFEKGSKQTDWKGITVGALQGGAMCLMFAGQSYAITNLVARAGSAVGASATATGYAAAGANALGITALGLGTEYILTGQISVEGAIFTVVMAVTTAGIQIMQVNKAAAQAKAQAEAALNEQIYNARHTFGFEDGVEVTADGLKAQFRKLSIQYHPDKGGTEAQMAIINDAYNTLQMNLAKINSEAVLAVGAKVAPEVVPQSAAQPAAEVPVNPSGETGLSVQGQAITIQLPQGQALTVPLAQGSVGAIAAASSGPVAKIDATVTGGAAPTAANLQAKMAEVDAKVVSRTTSRDNGTTVTVGKDANGTPVRTTIKNKLVEVNYFTDEHNNVQQFKVGGKVVGSYVYEGGETGVYYDAVGQVMTEEAFSEALTTATTKAYEAATPKVDARTQAAVDAVAKFSARYEAGEFPNPYKPMTAAEILDFVKPLEGNENVSELVEHVKADIAKGDMHNAEASAKLARGIVELKKYAEHIEYGRTAETKELLDNAVKVVGKEMLAEAASQTFDVNTKIGRQMLSEVRAVTDRQQSPSVLPEEFVGVKNKISQLENELQNLTAPNEETVANIESQITELRGKAQAKIDDLQRQLKQYGSGLDKYDQSHMDQIQAQIKALREIAPLDRTNINEVLQASPDEVFRPTKADNIKGQGISFKPVVPTDPEALASVTYRAVPVFTDARTVSEMISLAADNGIKIELVQDANGNYYPAVKAIWSQDGWFALDREGFVVEYGEIDVEANKDYLDMNWVEKNKYQNAEGKWVVKDCAIVAADKKTAADIMPHSYVMKVKNGSVPITQSNKSDWNGFQAHKDPNGVVNAVAYDSPQELTTLEGKITTDVTMGDVEGNVYNKFNDLKKQILKNKIQANPEDPNSQKFIDLIKAGKDDEAIALLREATKSSQTAQTDAAPVVSSEVSADNIKSGIQNAKSIDELRTLRDNIKNVQDKVLAQELREAYVQKEQALRAQLPQEVKAIENMYHAGANTDRDAVLAKAGFSEGVIDDLVAHGPWGDPRLDAALIDEVLNMVVYLEGEVANGAKVTKSLVEGAIDKFSPGASGASAAVQRSIIANYWSQGSKVYNAYGQKAPGQSTFSKGNLKAKWNKFTNSVKDFYEEVKFELGVKSKPSAKESLAQAKTELYSKWDTNKLVDEYNARFNYGVKDDMSIIRAELTARGFAPNKNGYYVVDLPKSATAEASVQSGHQLNPKLQTSLIEALHKIKIGDTSIVTNMIAKHPEFVQKLADVQKANGEPLFDAKNIDLVLANLREVIEHNPEKIWAVLNNPEEVADIAGWKTPAAGLWKAVGEPLQSTIDANPELFGAKSSTPKPAAQAELPNVSEDFVSKFAQARSTQDLEAMVKTAKTPEECEYVVAKLDNPKTKAVNGAAIQDIIDYAKFRAQSLRMDKYVQNHPATQQAQPKTGEVSATQAAAPVMKGSVAKCDIPSNMPQTKGQIGNVSVTVAGGDMTMIKADAYVVPEFINCASEGGVGGAVARRGGAGGLKAYDKHVHQNGALEWGDVVVTESGGGKTSHLIHAATAGAGADNSFEVVQKAVYNSLKAAQDQGMQSVVVPAMGTGIIGHLTDTQSAQAILAGVNQFAAEGGKMDVSVVVYSHGKPLQEFNETLANKSYESAKPVAGTKEFDARAWSAEIAETVQEMPVSSSEAPAAAVVSGGTQSAGNADAALVAELKEFKGPDGKTFLTQSDINDLLENCQHGFITDGKPIPDYQAKIKAVLSNPEEVALISSWKSRSAGIWKAIQDPLSSTENMYPELFGAKAAAEPKADTVAQTPKAEDPAIKAVKSLSDSERASVLEKAGFDESKIAELKAKSKFYGPELVDEALDMIVYLEQQVANGAKITKELVEGAIDKFSPGASGGSVYTQRSMIANEWNRGAEVFKAYGQEAPAEVVAKAAALAAAPKSNADTKPAAQTQTLAQKANHVTENGPQWLERRMTVKDSEIADMRTVKTLNPQTKDAVRVTYDAKGNEVRREDVYGGDIISTREEFLDSDGKVIKTNLYDHRDGNIYEEVRVERNGSETIEHGKRYTSDGRKVTEYYTRTRKGNNVTYIDYDAAGNTKSKYTLTKENGVETRTDIKYKDDQPVYEEIRVKNPDGTSETTEKDYAKGTKVIKKMDKNSSTYAMSETGINDEPEFFTKADVIRRSPDVWAGFPTLKTAIAEGEFNCSSAQSIVNTLRAKPKEVMEIVNLKKPDGSPRFTPTEVGTIVLNCANYLGTAKLKETIMTPMPNGSYRECYDIWCIMVDK